MAIIAIIDVRGALVDNFARYLHAKGVSRNVCQRCARCAYEFDTVILAQMMMYSGWGYFVHSVHNIVCSHYPYVVRSVYVQYVQMCGCQMHVHPHTSSLL